MNSGCTCDVVGDRAVETSAFLTCGDPGSVDRRCVKGCAARTGGSGEASSTPLLASVRKARRAAPVPSWWMRRGHRRAPPGYVSGTGTASRGAGLVTRTDSGGLKISGWNQQRSVVKRKPFAVVGATGGDRLDGGRGGVSFAYTDSGCRRWRGKPTTTDFRWCGRRLTIHILDVRQITEVIRPAACRVARRLPVEWPPRLGLRRVPGYGGPGWRRGLGVGSWERRSQMTDALPAVVRWKVIRSLRPAGA